MSVPSEPSVTWALPAGESARGAAGSVVVSLLLVAVVGALDVAAGPDVTFSSFYLVAVIFGTWRGGRRWGLVAAGCSALAGLLAELLLSEPYLHLESSHPSAWILVWNTVARLLVFVGAVVAVSTLQGLLRERDAKARELERALAEIRTLEGLLPLCAWCKRIRDEEDARRWKPLERYVAEHTDAAFTHGICPDCAQRMQREE